MYKYCSICGAKLKKKNGNLACEKCGFINYRNPRPTASGLVLYKNKILLTKRAVPPLKGWWDLPGGFVDRGETAEQALKRELKEETGLNVSELKFFGTYKGIYPSSFDPFHVLSVIFLVKSKKGELQALSDVKESRWFAKHEMPKKIAFDSNQEVIKDFLKIWK